MINIIIAEHQAIFRAGVAKVLAVEDDLRIVGQPQSSEQMLNALEHLRAHVLMISTRFLPQFSQVQELTARHNTAIMVLAEPGDAASAFIVMGALGVVYRSINGPTIVDAVRRLGRGELKPFSDWDDGRPETELNFKFYRQATNKIGGISDEAAAFLRRSF